MSPQTNLGAFPPAVSAVPHPWQQKAAPPSPALLRFSDFPVDNIVAMTFTNSIYSNAQVWAALQNAKGDLDIGMITEKDREEICSVLSQVKDLKLAPIPGELLKFGRFTIAVISGWSEARSANVYVIRVPGHGWMLLDVKEVPDPRS